MTYIEVQFVAHMHALEKHPHNYNLSILQQKELTQLHKRRIHRHRRVLFILAAGQLSLNRVGGAAWRTPDSEEVGTWDYQLMPVR